MRLENSHAALAADVRNQGVIGAPERRVSTTLAAVESSGTNAPASASARSIAVYLAAIKDLVERATTSRQLWIRQVGKVSQAIRIGDELAPVEAGVVGKDQAERFRKFREELNGLKPPASCESCHVAIVSWLEKQIAACEVMVEIGQTRNVDMMRQASGLLSEGRLDTARFKAEYTNLVTALQAHLKSRAPAKTKRVRWPFGTRPRVARMGTTRPSAP